MAAAAVVVVVVEVEVVVVVAAAAAAAAAAAVAALGMGRERQWTRETFAGPVASPKTKCKMCIFLPDGVVNNLLQGNNG